MGEETRAAARAIEMVERKDRVLIVEDEDNARKGYEQLLQRWGCDVVGVGTAEEALAKFASYQPDTLIADVELPGMNGLDLLRQLGPELYGVPAIIITGKGSEERAVAAIEAGGVSENQKDVEGARLRAALVPAAGEAVDPARPTVGTERDRRKGRRDAGADAGEAVARPGRPQGTPAGEQERDTGGRARSRGHQQGTGAGRQQRPTAARSLFSPERVSHPPAAAARTQGRHSAARRSYSARRQRQTWEACAWDRRGSIGHFHGTHLAGKYSRTAQRAGARFHHVRERLDYTRVPPGRVRKDGGEGAERSFGDQVSRGNNG